jgi:hypothetical protein
MTLSMPSLHRVLAAVRYSLLKRPSCVTGLLCACGPTAVGRFVVSAVVNAIKRQLRWTRTHVFIERGVTIAPSLAHSNAATAVVSELFVFRVVATLNHLLPRPIVPGLTHSVRALLRLAPTGGG